MIWLISSMQIFLLKKNIYLKRQKQAGLMHNNCCLDLHVSVSDNMPDVKIFSGIYHPNKAETTYRGIVLENLNSKDCHFYSWVNVPMYFFGGTGMYPVYRHSHNNSLYLSHWNDRLEMWVRKHFWSQENDLPVNVFCSVTMYLQYLKWLAMPPLKPSGSIPEHLVNASLHVFVTYRYK